MFKKICAPAKINLFLDVNDKRPDGYHDITTVFMPLFSLADKLAILPSVKMSISVAGNAGGVPADQTNLCWRAAAEFGLAAGIASNWQIRLTKNIPVAAGLGGGSADAAAVLLLLNEMYDYPLDELRLRTIAAKLGADVPYFLAPVIALGQGRGDVLSKLPGCVNTPILLVNPGFPISAKWAYEHLPAEREHPDVEALNTAIAEGNVNGIAKYAYNVMELPAREKFPVIEMLLDFIAGSEGCLSSNMSGSGPTVFGLCRTQRDANRIGAEVKKKFGNRFWVSVVA